MPLRYAGDSICLNTPADDGLLLLSSLVLPWSCMYSCCSALDYQPSRIKAEKLFVAGRLPVIRRVSRADLRFHNGFLLPFFPHAFISDRSEPVASSLEAIPPACKVLGGSEIPHVSRLRSQDRFYRSRVPIACNGRYIVAATLRANTRNNVSSWQTTS